MPRPFPIVGDAIADAMRDAMNAAVRNAAQSTVRSSSEAGGGQQQGAPDWGVVWVGAEEFAEIEQCTTQQSTAAIVRGADLLRNLDQKKKY
jgi:hypothetical protein